MKQKLIVLVILSLILVSCAGRHCFKIDGDYNGKKGAFEYCYDAGKSNSEGVPVLTGENGDLFGFSKDDIEKILGLLGDKPEAKGIESPCRRLVNKLKEK